MHNFDICEKSKNVELIHFEPIFSQFSHSMSFQFILLQQQQQKKKTANTQLLL